MAKITKIAAIKRWSVLGSQWLEIKYPNAKEVRDMIDFLRVQSTEDIVKSTAKLKIKLKKRKEERGE